MNPKFSVIIPVHNKFPHLERSISSVLNQTYPDLELILVDDASSDGSSEKLLEFTDSRIKRLKRDIPGPGGYAARNLGIKHATHEWVCFLDADDEWKPEVLETLAEVIKKNSDVEILCWGWIKSCNGVELIDSYSKKYQKEKINEFSLIEFLNGPQPLWTGGISMKKKLIEQARCFPEKGFKRGGDMDTWIRCLWHSRKSLRITKPMTYYYLDSVNMVTKAIDKDNSYSYSNFIMNIMNTTKDKRLIKAIRDFQNACTYAVLSERVGKGNHIDYSLILKMNTCFSFYFLLVKLHLKKLFIEIKLMNKHL